MPGRGQRIRSASSAPHRSSRAAKVHLPSATTPVLRLARLWLPVGPGRQQRPTPHQKRAEDQYAFHTLYRLRRATARRRRALRGMRHRLLLGALRTLRFCTGGAERHLGRFVVPSQAAAAPNNTKPTKSTRTPSRQRSKSARRTRRTSDGQGDVVWRNGLGRASSAHVCVPWGVRQWRTCLAWRGRRRLCTRRPRRGIDGR